MASINDLATAATIASSAVALQSSPKSEHAQPAQSPSSPAQNSPPRQAPAATATTTTAAAAAAANQAAAPHSSASTSASAAAAATAAAAAAMANEEGNSITVATSGGAPPQPSGTVLAAPRTEPQNPSVQTQAQVAPAAAAAGEASNGGVSVAENRTGDAMEGVVAEDTTTTTTTRDRPVRGAFVVFEGMDRAGKTTQAKLLQQRCIESGRETRFMRFPDRTTPIGRMIDSYLKGEADIEDHVIHLLFSANRWEAVKKIHAELEAGHTVVCDRFYHSGIVYSAAKRVKSLSLSWAKAPEAGLPRPDVVLFLDLEEAVARARGGWGGEVYEKGEMQRRVRDLFWGLSMGDLGSAASGVDSSNNGGGGGNGISGGGRALKRDVERLGNGVGKGDAVPAAEDGEFRQEEEDIQIVDADLGVEELSEKVWEHVLPRLQAVERGEVGRTVRTVR
ncbi:thymidylate kinase-domain-containing protein [Hypoxylon sp. FL1284]|nr:thymidylate kinase-domain-containing protein [Hypoxylon sp. FL1284]